MAESLTSASARTEARPQGPGNEHEKLRTIVAALDEGLVVLDRQLRVESINAQGESILQAAADDLLGRGIDEVAAEWNLRDGGPFAVSRLRHHLLRGLPYRNDDAFVVRSDGSITHVSLVMSPIAGDADRAGAVVCLRDITELKLAERRLRDSEQRFRHIFQSAPTGMLRISADGIVDDANVATVALLGYDRQELIGAPVARLWVPDEAADDQALLDVLLAGTGPGLWQGELRLHHADGRVVWTETSLARVATAGGEPPFVIAVVEDVTQRKRLEVELRHAQKLESVGRLAAGIAHEINTPVQFIGDNLQFLGTAVADLARRASIQVDEHRPDHADLAFVLEEAPLAVEQALEGIERISRIVRAMEVFGATRTDGGFDTVDPNEAVTTTVLVAASGVRDVADVETDLGDVPLISCALIDLNQALLHLIVNAADAIAAVVRGTTARGRIRVTTRPRDGGVEITVSDTGGGIAPGHAGRVFDPFFTTKPVGHGTGQGLAVVHAVVVERHGGEVTFTTEAGRGTTFRVWLPVSNPSTRST